MTPAEVVFRVGEQRKRFADRRRSFAWETFTPFEGPLAGLPGLDLVAADPIYIAEAARVRDRLQARQVEWLGQKWPLLGHDWLTTLWTLDPVTGLHWPGAGARSGYRDRGHRGDVKFVWEPNRLQVLQPLALLAAQGDAAAEQLGWDILAGWMEANSPYQGVNWSSGIEAASRIVSALVFIGGARDPLDAKRSDTIRRFLAANARLLWRFPSLHSSANNHRVSELAALLLLRACAPGLDLGEKIAQSITAELEHEVTRQFHPDGVGAEQSPTYAAYSVEWFTLAAIAAEASGTSVSSTYRERLAGAIDHLQWLLDEAGHQPRIGDDDEGRVLALGTESEPRYVASVAAMTARWLGKAGPSPAILDVAMRDRVLPSLPTTSETRAGTKTFPDGGRTAVRQPTPGGLAVLTIDHGPLGFLSIAAHGHADALAITLSWGDEPVLVDAGTYLYHAGGTIRDQLRGTAVHNTLTIEGQNQSRIVGPFAWADHARTELLSHDATQLTARCFGWRRRFGVIHERRVEWQRDGNFTVEDHLLGKAPTALTWSSGLSLAPHCRVTLADRKAEIVTPGGRRLVLRATEANWQLKRSVYSATFNKLEEIDRLELSGTYGSDQGTHRAAAFTIELQAD